MAIKSSLRRLMLPTGASDYIAEKVQRGLQILAMDWPVAAAVERLRSRVLDQLRANILGTNKQSRSSHRSTERNIVSDLNNSESRKTA